MIFVGLALPAHHVTQRYPAFVPTARVGDALPSVGLIDQDGRRFSLASGRRTIVSFAYTRCPDPTMCSLVTAKFAALQRTLRGTGIGLVEITLDPAFDRPPVLALYARAVGARPEAWTFATGSPQSVVALAERFGIVFSRGPHGALVHSEAVAVVAGDGTLEDRIDGARWSPADLAAQARQDAGLESNPLRRLALRFFARAGAMCGGSAGGPTLAAAIGLFFALTLVISLVVFRLCAPRTPGRSLF